MGVHMPHMRACPRARTTRSARTLQRALSARSRHIRLSLSSRARGNPQQRVGAMADRDRSRTPPARRGPAPPKSMPRPVLITKTPAPGPPPNLALVLPPATWPSPAAANYALTRALTGPATGVPSRSVAGRERSQQATGAPSQPAAGRRTSFQQSGDARQYVVQNPQRGFVPVRMLTAPRRQWSERTLYVSPNATWDHIKRRLTMILNQEAQSQDEVRSDHGEYRLIDQMTGQPLPYQQHVLARPPTSAASSSSTVESIWSNMRSVWANFEEGTPTGPEVARAEESGEEESPHECVVLVPSTNFVSEFAPATWHAGPRAS